MADFKYITRTSRYVRGMPQVYFCAHPDDLSRLLSPISEEILKYNDCAIFYSDGASEEDDDRLVRLAEMRLFVMPVTTRLLTARSLALDVDFRFALSHGIPVLPLMQEEGLVELFNERCGNLQFLSKEAHDETAIRYEDKLEKYLSSVLLGDELERRIRAAFSGYIFLSYRKRDRAYAKELMRLIHKNDFCRDVAIWYDEFLTPGEDFNESIRDALAKSDLFVLAVTPNLLREKDNYVVKTEYPMARGMQKKILPAELVSTEKAALDALFADLSAPVDAHDEVALASALSAHFAATAQAEDSPRHRFYIGLAYLSGVDVETDYARALLLITAAAEAGMTEAMEKLADMYEHGIGVPRSAAHSIEWQKRRLLRLTEALAHAPTDAGYVTLAKAHMRCADALAEEARLADAKEEYLLALTALSRVEIARAHLPFAAKIHDRIGNLLRREGLLTEAEEHYRTALAIREQLRENGNTPDVWRGIAISHNKLGAVCEAREDLTAAKAHYEQSYALFADIASKSNDFSAMRDLSAARLNLGDIARAMQDLTAAEAHYRAAVAILTPEAEKGELTGELCLYLERLATVLRRKGNLTEARALFDRAFVHRQKEAEETGTLRARRELAIAYNKRGSMCDAEGDPEAARDAYLASTALFREIASLADTVGAKRDLACSLLCFDTQTEARDTVRARYAEAVAILEALTHRSEAAYLKTDVKTAHARLAALDKEA